jgi:uncharacterized protein YecE (DUF72 family)
MGIEDIRIGTCGYSYDEWRDVFYPQDLKTTEFLRYYSLVFPFVEIDYSWYSMPKPAALEAMARQTMPEFLFALKVHRSLTHEVGEDWKISAEQLSIAAEVLRSRGRLAALLIQLPYRFSYTAEHRLYLGDLCSALSAFPLVVEFRNEGWYQQRVFDELARRDISMALLDRPDLPGLPPETQILTSNMVYYRLHGRNSGQWWGGDATSRYDYDYSPQELKERAHAIIALSKKASRIFVAFNNHARGNATKNARAITGYVRELFV